MFYYHVLSLLLDEYLNFDCSSHVHLDHLLAHLPELLGVLKVLGLGLGLILPAVAVVAAVVVRDALLHGAVDRGVGAALRGLDEVGGAPPDAPHAPIHVLHMATEVSGDDATV